MIEKKLLCFRATRRAIGLALFSGLTLECTFVRELSSEPRSAGQSTRAFVRWVLETFPADAILVEEPVTKPGTRAWELGRIICDEVATVHGSAATASSRDVLAPRDRPSRTPRQELRTLVRLLWPQFVARPCNPVALDAAALGLHHQIASLIIDT